jgi:hypothetical protein
MEQDNQARRDAVPQHVVDSVIIPEAADEARDSEFRFTAYRGLDRRDRDGVAGNHHVRQRGGPLLHRRIVCLDRGSRSS